MPAKRIPKKAAEKTAKNKAATKSARIKSTSLRFKAQTNSTRLLTSKEGKLLRGKGVSSSGFASRRKAKPEEFTGRILVAFDFEAPGKDILIQAHKAKINLMLPEDIQERKGQYISQALEHTDGIFFHRFKIAYLNRFAVDRLTRWQRSPNSYIVSLRPEHYLYGTYAKSVKGTSFKLPFTDSPNATWGIQAINALSGSCTGKGVKVAVLDTGLDLGHPDFIYRTIQQRSFVGTLNANDGHGHGTHCVGVACGGRSGGTGIRYGMAQGADIYVGKVLNDKKKGTELQLTLGIDWAFSNGCKVISMSIGRPAKTGAPHDGIFEGVAQFMLNNNCILVAASGNFSNRRLNHIAPVSHPANCPSILSVAALDQFLQVSNYSSGKADSIGGDVDLSAPGDDILSTWKGSSYARCSGTSMATPFVAGLVAMLWEEFPHLNAREIWVELLRRIFPLGSPVSDVGAGLAHAK